MRTLVPLLLGTLVLAGCGSDASLAGEAGGTAPAAPASSSAASPGEGESPGPAAESLAAAAEREARQQDSQPSSPGRRTSPGRASPSIPPREGLVTGADVSYPNCPRDIGIPQRETRGYPMPKPGAEFVVIGLTNGPAYFPNPCLAEQVDWAKRHDMMVAAYNVLSFPNTKQLRQYAADGPHDASTRQGRLRNVGRAQARLAMQWMQRTGLQTPMVWLDIEPVSDWEWTDDTQANVAVIQGAVRAYRDAGYRIGFYSVPSLWADIAGDWGLGLPEWRSAGETSRQEALTRCREPRHSIQGGRPVLAQWWDETRDYDVTCPGVAQNLGRWFHQY